MLRHVRLFYGGIQRDVVAQGQLSRSKPTYIRGEPVSQSKSRHFSARLLISKQNKRSHQPTWSQQPSRHIVWWAKQDDRLLRSNYEAGICPGPLRLEPSQSASLFLKKNRFVSRLIGDHKMMEALQVRKYNCLNASRSQWCIADSSIRKWGSVHSRSSKRPYNGLLHKETSTQSETGNNGKKKTKKLNGFPIPGIEPGAARFFSITAMKAGYVNPYTISDVSLAKTSYSIIYDMQYISREYPSKSRTN